MTVSLLFADIFTTSEISQEKIEKLKENILKKNRLKNKYINLRKEKRLILFDWSKNFKTACIGKFNPINIETEKEIFFESEKKYNPIFRYNVPPTINPK